MDDLQGEGCCSLALSSTSSLLHTPTQEYTAVMEVN